MIAVTGATGQLGRLVIEALLRTEAPGSVAALVRSTDKAADLSALGVVVRSADYDKPETLGPALEGVDRLLLISSSEVGKRAEQHKAVIAAAKAAGVGLVAYTSILRADTSPMALAEEHNQTEAALASAGVRHVVLRNGWYTENYAGGISAAPEHGAMIGSAGEGRIAAASRRDYAEAAAAVLVSAEDQAGKVYELAGDDAFTMAELAAEVARQSGKPVVYNDLPEAAYKEALVGMGLPDGLAAILADSDAKAAEGALFDDGRALSALIGRPTTPVAKIVADILRG
ncbi:SDR family oxidoreductase [Algicella marina]|uniref:NAD(P)H-binding protein n=1 Tax=Algicella marina TaxID=2683284 RepID=A0A6P1T1S8_9RHOB|nr:SDR family oxidoreductase [Algicella marina]QHQ35691.1 NAD(P)H-binding protein [Algicella marina]